MGAEFYEELKAMIGQVSDSFAYSFNYFILNLLGKGDR